MIKIIAIIYFTFAVIFAMVAVYVNAVRKSIGKEPYHWIAIVVMSIGWPYYVANILRK